MPVEAKDLWGLALDHLQVDPKDLVEAIEDQVCRGDLDYRSQEPFGQPHVYLVDACDVFLRKLSSARIKDRDDLRMLAP